jgi:hypothetical protein
MLFKFWEYYFSKRQSMVLLMCFEEMCGQGFNVK